MDESEQTQSEEVSLVDIAASESKSGSKGSESGPDSGLDKSSTSKDNITTTPFSKTGTTSTSSERSSKLSSKKSSDESSEHGPEVSGDTQGSSQKSVGQSARSAERVRRSLSTQWSKEDSGPSYKSLAGASSEHSTPLPDGAGGPGSIDIMAKMMEIMAKGSAPAPSRAPGDIKGVPDIFAMMMKGGGMPDMMAMMGKGGMPDMTKGGGMADMKAMMSKMQSNPMGMAKLFDCIIDVSLANPDSDVSDDDEDSIPIEIPCQYCSRIFTNQMSLKTHILVAHEHEDTSVLNLTKLVIDKGKRGMKDRSSRRKQSKDCEKSVAVEAAGTGVQQTLSIAHTKVASSQEDLSAAEPSTKGVKRGRSESEAVEISGASGIEEGSLHKEQGAIRLGSGAVPSSCAGTSPPESRKRSARLRSLRSCSGDSPSQVTTKKSKSGDGKLDRGNSHTQKRDPLRGQSTQSSDDVNKPSSEQACARDSRSCDAAKQTSKHKPTKANSKEPSPVSVASTTTRSRRISRKDKDATCTDSDVNVEPPPREASQGSRGKGCKGRQSTSVPAVSVPPTSSSTQKSQSPSRSRRSLRSRKSH